MRQTNWKTTLGGLAVWVLIALKALNGGDITSEDWALVGGGAALVAARDHDK